MEEEGRRGRGEEGRRREEGRIKKGRRGGEKERPTTVMPPRLHVMPHGRPCHFPRVQPEMKVIPTPRRSTTPPPKVKPPTSLVVSHNVVYVVASLRAVCGLVGLRAICRCVGHHAEIVDVGHRATFFLVGFGSLPI